MHPPSRLGKYELRREVGRGAMGVVYEAFDPSIGRSVAIKLFHPGSSLAASADELGARFRREAQVAGRLSHPNLVPIYEFGDATGSDESSPYIVMEFVRGADLKALSASRGRFSLPEIARIMAELLAALQHAHERDVIHRDIKPANVMLCEDGRLKVTDFGIAKTADSDLTMTGSMLGTVAYMSPEQLTGAPIDRRTDIYSAGVILYQLLTGEAPFVGAATTIIQKILNQEPVAPSVLNVAVPRALDAVVRKAMAKTPAERYASAAAFSDAVAKAIGHGDDDRTTVIAPVPAPVTSPSARRPARLAAAGAVCVLVLAAAGFYWLGSRGPLDGRGRAAAPPASAPTAVATAPSDAAEATRVVAPSARRDASSPVAIVAPARPVASAVRARVALAAPSKPAVAPAAAAEPARMSPPRVAASTAIAPASPAPTLPPPLAAAPPPAVSASSTPPGPAKATPARIAAASAPAPGRAASSAGSLPATAKAGAAIASAPSPGPGNAALAICEVKARAGDAACQTHLGTIYRNGDGVPRNDAEALRWYRLAADQGFADAQNRLGVMLAAGKGIAADQNEAARWYRKAADQGLAAAQNNLGHCYERGEGVVASQVLAAEWFGKAAGQGHAAAQYSLGRMYLGGVGVFKDAEKGRVLLEKSAAQGNANAAYLLGTLHEKGVGVPQSNTQAAYWYRLASTRPDPGLSAPSRERIRSFLAAHP